MKYVVALICEYEFQTQVLESDGASSNPASSALSFLLPGGATSCPTFLRLGVLWLGLWQGVSKLLV